MTLSLTRRTVVRSLACTLGVSTCGLPSFAALPASPAPADGWTPEWDSALRDADILRLGRSYDASAQMTGEHRGPEYNYQSNLRSILAHTTRTSLEYASLLLYTNDTALHERAYAILRRVLPLQVVDPASRYFGLWSWYLEEPVDKMHAADFNWADFNGAILLNILLTHESSLPADLAAQCRTALRNAAVSIRKRNVSPYYTNIAFQGTYVTLATAELFGDNDLLDYARQRFVRLAAAVDESGSFSEYNSPTYIAVTIENLTRILMYVKDPGSRAIATRLNALAWKHIAEHWHAPTRQLAGPMSRAYSNDIGSPMWIQKGTGNQVRFVTLDDIKRRAPGGEASFSTVDFRCPDELIPLFLTTPRHQHREVFIAGQTLIESIYDTKREIAVAPVEGTTLLTPAFALGSANRSDFWVQRRPLIAYWGGANHPPQCLQMRVVKDDYDFTSALLYSAQNQGSVLGSIRFRSDGGDKHPGLDPIKDQTFTATSMRVELLLGQWKTSNRILVDGKPVMQYPASFPATSRIALDAGDVKIFFKAHTARFVDDAAQMQIAQTGPDATVSLYLMQRAAPGPIHWPDLTTAGCDFTLWMDDSRR